MNGICPHCQIRLKEPPFNEKRETNEVIVIITYRRLVESGIEIKNIKDIGYCEICKATIDDLEDQKKSGSK